MYVPPRPRAMARAGAEGKRLRSTILLLLASSLSSAPLHPMYLTVRPPAASGPPPFPVNRTSRLGSALRCPVVRLYALMSSSTSSRRSNSPRAAAVMGARWPRLLHESKHAWQHHAGCRWTRARRRSTHRTRAAGSSASRVRERGAGWEWVQAALWPAVLRGWVIGRWVFCGYPLLQQAGVHVQDCCERVRLWGG